jgi:hypothetical protein
MEEILLPTQIIKCKKKETLKLSEQIMIVLVVGSWLVDTNMQHVIAIPLIKQSLEVLKRCLKYV